MVGLGIGALLANLTPIGRVFRRWSAIVAAMLTGLSLLFLLAVARTDPGEEAGLAMLGLLCVIAALDLCYVSRLRVMVVLSGLLMIPVVAALDSSALFSAFAWFSAALFAMWLLSVDEQRSLDRPEPLDGLAVAPRGRGVDLVRTIAMALLAGFTLAFLLSTPSCSFSPLARALEWLPWRRRAARVDRALGDPIELHELDDDGHEFSTYVNPRGRRFIVDPTTNEGYGVVDRDGTTTIVDAADREVGHFEDGDLVVTDPSGETVRYQRDDRGWFVESPDGTRYDVVPNGSGSELVSPGNGVVAGTEVGRSDRYLLDDDAGGPADLDRNDDGRIPAPNNAILDATTGTGEDWTEYSRGDEQVTVHGERGSERTYRTTDEGYDVDVDPGYDSNVDDHSYSIDEGDDTLTAYDDQDRKILEIPIDREGNALDDVEEPRDIDVEEQQPDTDDGDRPSPPWKGIAIVVVVLAAIGAGIAFWIWKRRQGDGEQEDRDWAEQQVRRLEQWGRDHTFPRERAESIVRYAARLDTEIARDGTLPEIGDVLDDALFGRRPIAMEARMRAEAAIDRLIEEHPKPGRAERLRGGPDQDGDRTPAGTARS